MNASLRRRKRSFGRTRSTRARTASGCNAAFAAVTPVTPRALSGIAATNQ
jgi:hypothetical protein